MNLREAIKSNYPNYTDSEVTELITAMTESIIAGEDPEEILLDEGFEADYVIDLLEYMA